MRKLKWSGQFWVPEAPERPLWGRLRYDPGGTTSLTLDGNIVTEPYARNLRIPEIHGQLYEGTLCVLRDVWGDVETFRTQSETSRTLLESDLFLLGLDRAASAADRFARSSVKLSHLNDWFGRPLSLAYQNRSFEECLVKFEPDRAEARAELDAVPFKLSVFCGRTLPSVPDSKRVEFTYDYKLIVTPDAPQPLTWHLRAAAMLREFFMFLVGSGVYTLDLRLFPGDTPQEGLVQVFPRVAVPMVVRLEPRYFYADHRKVKEQFPALFASWMREQDRLIVVRHALSDLLTVDGTSREAVFTRVVQTMEHFHGLVSPSAGRYVGRATWRRFTRWLEDRFPELWLEGEPAERSELLAHKAPLMGRIKGVNTLSFRTRIRALFDAVALGELYPIIDNPREATEYLDRLMPRIEATRNYLTHFSAEQRVLALSGRELETVTLQCWAVLVYSLARHLGLEVEIAGDLALSARKAMFLVDTQTEL